MNVYFVWRLGNHPQSLKFFFTDSEQVLWRKGKETPNKIRFYIIKDDKGHTFCIMGQQVDSVSELKQMF